VPRRIHLGQDIVAITLTRYHRPLWIGSAMLLGLAVIPASHGSPSQFWGFALAFSGVSDLPGRSLVQAQTAGKPSPRQGARGLPLRVGPPLRGAERRGPLRDPRMFCLC
jgi:hypothetical protein